MLNNNKQVLSKVTYEEAKEKVAQYVLEDRIVNHVDKRYYNNSEGMRAVIVDGGKLAIEYNNEVFVLNDWSKGQLVKLIKNTFTPGSFLTLSNATQSVVLNDLIGKVPAKRFRFRSKKGGVDTHETVGILSLNYVPVNHDFLFRYIDAIQDRLSSGFQLSVNYDYCIVRAPMKKISDMDAGIFAGVDFLNGQTGKQSLNISSLIWEKVCTNGLVLAREDESFISHKHIGSNFNQKVFEFPHWWNTILNRISATLSNVSQVVVPNAHDFIKKELVKKYSMISAELAQKMYNYVANHDVTVRREDKASAFGILQSLTRLSQDYNGFKRYEMDLVASKIMEDYKWYQQ